MSGLRTMIRPDGRCFLVDPDLSLAREHELAAIAGDLGSDLYITLDEADTAGRLVAGRLGFVVNRRESHYLIPTDPHVTGLSAAAAPPGFAFVGADRIEEDRLRLLDDALRQDVPGADGWRWDEAGFHEETYESPQFDPATYLVAVAENGELAGLVRVWNRPETPRLGMIAVLAPYRRRGLARALLAQAFDVLHRRGRAEVTTEVDDANVSSTSLMKTLGARRTGGSIELIRRVAAAAGS